MVNAFRKSIPLLLLFLATSTVPKLQVARNISSKKSSDICIKNFAAIARNIQSRRITKDLQTLKIIATPELHGDHSTPVHILEYFENILRGIFKEQLQKGIHLNAELSNSKAEALAYELNLLFKLLLVPPTTTRKVEIQPGKVIWGSVQEEMEHLSSLEQIRKVIGPITWDHQYQIWDTLAKKRPSINRSDFDKLSFFDFLIHNGDRHFKNVLIAKKGKVIAIDHGASFTGVGKTLRPFTERRVQIDRFFATTDGKRVLDQLRELDQKRFKYFLQDYISENDATGLMRRINHLIRRENYKQRSRILENFNEQDLHHFLTNLIKNEDYEEAQFLFEAAEIDSQAINVITHFIYKDLKKELRDKLLREVTIDPVSNLNSRMAVFRIYGG